ncbi:MAG TPA: response regulator [Caulobacteraceae bacterium]|nr:response regulator [Caulobacteraceae bacterium]
MLSVDRKTVQAMASILARVLILDPAPASARLLGELLQSIGLGQSWVAASTEQALSLAGAADPLLIFTEFAGDNADGVRFTRRLRRGTLACRKAPVIMVTAQATPASIWAARDAGVHEFLRKPYTIKDLVRRIEAVATKPRNWVEAVDYVGPDRRRFNSGEYRGARRRRVDGAEDPAEARIVQALKIVSAALGAIEFDRAQAFRALNAQAAELQKAGATARRSALVSAAHGLQQRLIQIGSAGELTREVVEMEALALLTYLPADEAA